MFVRDYAAMSLCFLLSFNVSLRHIKFFYSLSISTIISSMAGALKNSKIALRCWKFSKTPEQTNKKPKPQMPNNKYHQRNKTSWGLRNPAHDMLVSMDMLSAL